MASSMSIPHALSVIDHHLVSKRTAKAANGTNGDISLASRQAASNSAKRLANARDEPPRATLPAFYVNWRGDGPSPFDSHRGQYQRSVREIWECSNDFEIQEHCNPPHTGPEEGRKSEYVLDRVKDVDTSLVVKPDCFHSTVHPPVANLLPSREEEDLSVIKNPRRDRLVLDREIEKDSAFVFGEHLKLRKNGLHKSCIRNYPHGALGIRESPYGNPGEVYGDHRQALWRRSMRDTRDLRQPVEGPEDHLKGAVVMGGERKLRGLRSDPPPDNMLGGTFRLYP